MAKNEDYTLWTDEELAEAENAISLEVRELDSFVMDARQKMKDLQVKVNPIRLEIEYRKLAKAIKDPRTQGVGFGG